MKMNKEVIVCSIVVLVVSLAVSSMANLQEDEQQCADQLTTLASCIPYVSGTAQKPTPECCQDTQKVKANSPKCLCVLIKESTDPSMGLPINTTLALKMPSLCNIDAKVSNCPTLLNLAPDSPDAKIFKDADPDSTSTATSTTDSPSTSSSSSTSSGSPSSNSSSSSSGSSSGSDSKSTTTSNSGGPKLKLVESATLLMMAASFAWMFI